MKLGGKTVRVCCVFAVRCIAAFTACMPTIGRRSSGMGFVKDRPLFILEGPEGSPWAMQAYSQIVDPNLTHDQLEKLDEKLKLPPGWRFRVAIAGRDLAVKASDGHARIVQDELENPSDKCFEEAGRSACTYKL